MSAELITRRIAGGGGLSAQLAWRRWWAFGLLVAAWLCANTPQAAGPEVIEWFRGLRQFSHQTRLAQSVAELVAATDADRPAMPRMAHAERERGESTTVPVPPEALVKLQILALDEGPGWSRPVEGDDCRWTSCRWAGGAGVRRTQWRPPRVRGLIG